MINKLLTWLLSVSYDTGVFIEGQSDKMTFDDWINREAINKLESSAERELFTLLSQILLFSIAALIILLISLPFAFL